MGYVYFIYDSKYIKIGFTNNLTARKKSLQTSNPNKLIVLGYIFGNKFTEQELHKTFKQYHVHGEWFRPEQDLLDYINNNNELEVYIDWLQDKLQVYKKMKVI
jgi:hypothetical protein